MKKNILLYIISLCLAFILAGIFGSNYFHFVDSIRSGFIPNSTENYIVGLPLGYIFFIFLIFTGFSRSHKYYWIVISLIPAAAFEIYFDWQHILVPVILGLAGWLIGFGISKAHRLFRKKSQIRVWSRLNMSKTNYILLFLVVVAVCIFYFVSSLQIFAIAFLVFLGAALFIYNLSIKKNLVNYFLILLGLVMIGYFGWPLYLIFALRHAFS